MDILRVEEARGGEGRAAARVQRDDHVELGGDLVQCPDQFGGLLRRVDVRGPVQGGDHVPAVAEAVGGAGRGSVELVEVGEQRVDHRVADKVHRVRRPALAGQVAKRLGRRAEQQVAQLVRQPPVDLLGHRVVEAPQARLDVRQRDAELRPGERGPDRRVDVPVQDDQGRRGLQELALHPHQHARRHRGLRPGAHAEVDVRLRQPELDEEHVRHPLVVMLPGVHDTLGDAERGERADHRRGLDEIRPGPEYVRDRRAHSLTASPSRLVRGPTGSRTISLSEDSPPCPRVPPGRFMCTSSYGNLLGARSGRPEDTDMRCLLTGVVLARWSPVPGRAGGATREAAPTDQGSRSHKEAAESRSH